jgi:hypothetical protein
MSRKDYELIAEAFATARRNFAGLPMSASLRAYQEQQRVCVASVCAALKLDNPRFDQARFMDACYRDLEGSYNG